VSDDELSKEITRRRMAEEALCLYGERIDAFFHKNPSPLFISRLSDGCILECNHSFCEATGFPLNELIGRTSVELGLTPNSDRSWIIQVLSEKKEIRGLEATVRICSGELVHGLFSLTLTEYEGEPSILGVFQDITKSKLAAQRIRASERELNGILENMQDTYYRTDLDGCVVRASPSVEKLLQFSQDEVLGMRLANLYVDPAGRDMLLTALRENGGAVHGWEALLRRKDGSTVWVSTNAQYYHDEQGNVAGVEGTTRDISERKKFEDEIKALANYDSLTGLPNRRLFYDRLQQVITQAHRSKRSAALMFIDLDGFKDVNDNFGHEMGDLLLISAARRLSGCVRESDTVARIGGDEFVVIVPEIQDHEGVASLSEKILRCLSDAFLLTEESVSISASIGVAYYPADGATANELVKHADLAMYLAKDGGRNACRYYEVDMKKRDNR
jgi:diguanylate cyclase (GGDEF)-like protein/PAS domain S-box-containing protein